MDSRQSTFNNGTLIIKRPRKILDQGYYTCSASDDRHDSHSGSIQVKVISKFLVQCCSVLEKSPFGAKSDFEIWAFKFFLFFGPEKSSKEGLEVATPENLKWKKYIRQSENANGSPLEPLWGSKKLKVSTKRTL